MTKNEIYKKLSELSLSENGLIVAITGRSCSGKSTFAKYLLDRFREDNKEVIALCEDSWYKNLCDIKRDSNGYYDMENISSFCVEELHNDLSKLFNGFCYMPDYCIEKNERIAKNIYVKGANIIILEGLHAVEILKTQKCSFNKVYIMVNTPLDVCIQRRIDRDSVEYNVPVDVVKNHYKNVIEPHYSLFYNYQLSIVKKEGERGLILNE